MSDSDDVEFGYTEWHCTNCGRSAPRHNPPCNRCGNMRFEQVEVHESDFDDEIAGVSTGELLRENAVTVGIGVVLLLGATVAALAWTGVFVISDPIGLGIRFGAVDAVAPDDDDTLTAAELHGRIADRHADTSMHWYGQGLELSYRSDATTNRELVDETTTIAVWYADYVGDGGEADSLEMTVRTDERRARVTVDRADAVAFATDDITEAQYRSRIFQTDSRS